MNITLIAYLALSAFLLYYFKASDDFILSFLSINALFLIKFIRRNLITRFLLKLIKKKNFLPQISKTEEIALKAGNVWIEREFFSGKPNFKKIFKHPYHRLSKKEHLFLNKEVEQACEMADDWQIFRKRDMNKELWDYLKKNKFFAMIIPKKFGGLGFSALAHSEIVQKLATRSQTLAITVMVPNSLGPAELIIKYGTEKQKKYYLPRLADGRELPCFALTEPLAGSDATSINARGEVFLDKKDKKIKIKLNFEKRYITLGAVATVIGLAFKLNDPQNLINKQKKDLGISCALLNSKVAGLTIRRHDPLGIPFVNASLVGKNIIINVEDIIGGPKQAGNGWKMLMECLAVGRGISLPATSTGGAKLVTKVTANYCKIRKQFGVEIGKFEAIQEKLAKISAFSYILESSRIWTASAIDNGYKPSVANAIMKYHSTEMFREIINDGMDVLGGMAICRGPNNLLAHPYMATPVGITVEGANIMTRSLMIFGQGLIRCHPYVYNELNALLDNDLKKFDDNLFKHIGYLLKNKIRFLWLYLTRSVFVWTASKGKAKKYERKLAYISTKFALFADLSLLLYGGNIKKKEFLSGKFADILSYQYLATATIKRYLNEGCKKEQESYFCWSMDYLLSKTDQSFAVLYQNFSKGLFWKIWIKYMVGFMHRINPITAEPSDELSAKLATDLISSKKPQEILTKNVFISKDKEDYLHKLSKCYELTLALEKTERKIKTAIKEKKLNKKSSNLLKEAVQEKIIPIAEKTKLEKLYKLQEEMVQVNSFEDKDYFFTNN